jgi:hypothetical protein
LDTESNGVESDRKPVSTPGPLVFLSPVIAIIRI